MNMDERWVRRTPKSMLDSFHWFEGEGFEFIIEDLLALPQNKPIIAEGFRLLPRLVAPLLEDRTRATWLLPTSDFRRIAFDARASTWDIPSRTSDPEKALANLLSRDALFTERLQADIKSLRLHSIIVDGSLSEDQLLKVVNAHLFGEVGPV